MPQIKEEDLIKLYSDIEKLEDEKKALQKGYIDLKLKLNKINQEHKKSRWILLLLFIILIASITYFYTNHVKAKATIEKTKDQKIALLDSIHKISTLIPNKNIAEVVYSIQLGVYKGLDIKLTPQEAVNFTEIKTDYGSAYQIGSFLSYKTATEFKNELKKIELKDVFIVAYNKKKERKDYSRRYTKWCSWTTTNS